MPKAIVTYGRSWQALAIVRSLGRQGIDVVVGEDSPFAPCFFSKYCSASFRYPSPTEDPEGFLDRLLEVVKEHAPPSGDDRYVLMPVHKETWLIAEHRQRFEPYIRVPLASHSKMVLVHNKGRLAKLAQELKIPIPETRFFESVDELYRAVPDLSFPQFVKIREGAAGVGIKKVNNPEELLAAFKRFVSGYGLEPADYPIVQAGVPGHDYCVTTLFNQGSLVASMTYRNIRAFPKETGAGALRETVPFEEAEAAAEKLLSHLNWHGIAELDFRKAEGTAPYLIEVNPRFFGGLPQSVASNVDYPQLLFRIACGEDVQAAHQVDFKARTESPVSGLLATLDEIAHDEGRIAKLKRLRDETRALGKSGLGDAKDFKPFFRALKEVVDPQDIKRTIEEKLEVHQGTVNDVLQSDDPLPALGLLYPLTLMIKHGKLSMGVLASEKEVEEEKPRRRFRDLLARPTWATLAVTGLVFGACLFLQSWSWTAGNVGYWSALPQRAAEQLLGEVRDASTLLGAAKMTGYYALNFLFYYLLAALLLRQRGKPQRH